MLFEGIVNFVKSCTNLIYEEINNAWKSEGNESKKMVAETQKQWNVL